VFHARFRIHKQIFIDFHENFSKISLYKFIEFQNQKQEMSSIVRYLYDWIYNLITYPFATNSDTTINTNTTIYIYILELEQNKYYVGQSVEPEIRLQSHFDGHAAQWTQMYKPIRVLSVEPKVSAFDEDGYTIQMMMKHGIDNVRGGAFCTIHLDEVTRRVIEDLIASEYDQCYNCKGYGHFTKECPQKTSSRKLTGWTSEEEMELLNEIANRKSIKEIAILHKRSQQAIEYKLKKIIQNRMAIEHKTPNEIAIALQMQPFEVNRLLALRG